MRAFATKALVRSRAMKPMPVLRMLMTRRMNTSADDGNIENKTQKLQIFPIFPWFHV